MFTPRCHPYPGPRRLYCTATPTTSTSSHASPPLSHFCLYLGLTHHFPTHAFLLCLPASCLPALHLPPARTHYTASPPAMNTTRELGGRTRCTRCTRRVAAVAFLLLLFCNTRALLPPHAACAPRLHVPAAPRLHTLSAYTLPLWLFITWKMTLARGRRRRALTAHPASHLHHLRRTHHLHYPTTGAEETDALHTCAGGRYFHHVEGDDGNTGRRRTPPHPPLPHLPSYRDEGEM